MNSDNPPAQGKGALGKTESNDGKGVGELWQRTAIAAYFRSEARGFVPGYELDDWLSAERELDAPKPESMSEEAEVMTTAPPPAKRMKRREPVPTTAVETTKTTAKRSTRSRKEKSGKAPQLGGIA